MKSPIHNQVPESSRAREEIRMLLLSSTSDRERQNILSRLKVTHQITAPLLPLIFSNLHSKNYDLQEMIFDLAAFMEEQGYSLEAICTDLASHLSSPREKLRNQATQMLRKMGPKAKAAEDFALGCLRNRDPQISICGLQILKSLESSLSRSISPRVRAVLELHPNHHEIRTLTNELLQLLDSLAEVPAASVHSIPEHPCLLVDPDSDFRNNLAINLQRNGIDSRGCNSAEEAVKILESGEKFSAVICEIKLPGMSGLQLVQWIKQTANLSGVAVMVLSSISNVQIINAARGSGVAEYILKNTQSQATVKMIQNATLQQY